jgi:eukaryotic-like serine/threonine-protein kinase
MRSAVPPSNGRPPSSEGTDVDGEWTVPGYRHVRRLGEGAAGLVFQAEHVQTGTPVAIKYLNHQLLADEELLTRFREEARLIGGLTDPHIVRLHEYVETQYGAAIVMELVDGVSLAQLIGSEGPTEAEAALLVLKGALLGLSAAHQSGIVHRDFKPGNVLIDRNGQSRLADFGIAIRAGENVPSAGTPAYMAPEQWGGRPVTPASDVYSATAVFYECVTGHLPYPAQTLPQLALAHRTSAIPVTFVPEPLQQLVQHGLAKDVYDRPTSAASFLSELEAVALGAYGFGWEERGRSQLKERAATLALLFPAAHQSDNPSAASTMAVSELDDDEWYDDDRGNARRNAFILAATALAVLLIGGGGAIVLAAGSGSASASSPKTSLSSAGPTTSDSGSPTTDPSGQPTTTPTTKPTKSATPRPTPTKTTKPTPTPTLTPSKTPKITPKTTVTGITVVWGPPTGHTVTGTATITTNGTANVIIAVSYLDTGVQAHSDPTVTRSGATSYKVSLSYKFPASECNSGRTVYTWGVGVDAAGAGGGRSTPASVNAPACRGFLG